ncbi:hypothetical protein [Saccharothrix longispora]|uniref:hypothetical protein n=1 Tax=Saccharothrix longispora TaxID=33920 RepID=UPI0028FD8B52|nr:hypothetical protein [Saccharothrix longispora]MBY8850039.1 hypothetical protein [Saccharothrix sp. MB29]MDU0287985.1 hypothetical protein [Saccharothrix longispora]
MVLLGLAFTLVQGPLVIVAVEGVADAEQGLAGGIRNTSFQFGAALGLTPPRRSPSRRGRRARRRVSTTPCWCRSSPPPPPCWWWRPACAR